MEEGDVPLRISLGPGRQSFVRNFPCFMKVPEIIQLVALELEQDSTQYGLLLVDLQTHHLEWQTNSSYALQVYLQLEKNPNLELRWNKRRRPVRVLMMDSTFRTHLIDDTSTCADIAEEIVRRFGVECAINYSTLKEGTYEIMPPLSTMRQKGFVGDVTLGICSREDSLIPTIEMFIPIPSRQGKLVVKFPYSELKGKWSKLYGVLKKDLLELYRSREIAEEDPDDCVARYDLATFSSARRTQGGISKGFCFEMEPKQEEQGVLLCSATDEEDRRLWIEEVERSISMFSRNTSFFATPDGHRSEQVAGYRHARAITITSNDKPRLPRTVSSPESKNEIARLKLVRSVSSKITRMALQRDKAKSGNGDAPNRSLPETGSAIASKSRKGSAERPYNNVQPSRAKRPIPGLQAHRRRASSCTGLSDSFHDHPFDVTELDELEFTGTNSTDFYDLSSDDEELVQCVNLSTDPERFLIELEDSDSENESFLVRFVESEPQDCHSLLEEFSCTIGAVELKPYITIESVEFSQTIRSTSVGYSVRREESVHWEEQRYYLIPPACNIDV